LQWTGGAQNVITANDQLLNKPSYDMQYSSVACTKIALMEAVFDSETYFGGE